MFNKIYQGIITQMKDIIDRTFGIIDSTGTIIACSDFSKTEQITTALSIDPNNAKKSFVKNGVTYQVIAGENKDYEIIFIDGSDEQAAKYAQLLAISFFNIKQYYDERFDRNNFVKNVILDNVLPGDIFVKARDLHFCVDANRVVMLIRILSCNDISAYEVIQNLFPDKQKDFVFNMNETDIVLVKEVKSEIGIKEFEKLARSIVDTLGSEFYTKVIIGIGTSVPSLSDLAKSFKESQIALEVGKVFDIEKSIIGYENLGIARLIYQLPTTLCEMFLREVFKNGSIDSLDHETLFTIQRFFENNLNVSETSRKLFVHRNTLVYRLEKIKKLTGLDLREFDHAIIFKVALMVKKYLRSNPIKY